MLGIAFRTIAIATLFIAAGVVAPPVAGASPSGPCASSAVGTVVPQANGYSLCTSVGWINVNGPLNPKGDCAHLGTVGPNNDGTYTICTNLGWVDVNRPVCTDFPGVFNCGVKP
jgi:hypothetical protein